MFGQYLSSALRPNSVRNNGIAKTATYGSGADKKGKEIPGSGHFSRIPKPFCMLPTVVRNVSKVQRLNRRNCRTKAAACNARARILHCDLFSMTAFAREGFGTHIPTRYVATERTGTMRRSATRGRGSEAPDQRRNHMQQRGRGHDRVRLLLSAFLLHPTTCKAARKRLCSLGTPHQGQHLLQQRQEQTSWYRH